MRKKLLILLLLCFSTLVLALSCFACANKSSDESEKSDSSAEDSSFNYDSPDLIFDSNPSNFVFEFRDYDMSAIVYIQEYKGNSKYVEIPSEVVSGGNTYTVKVIGEGKLSGNNNKNNAEYIRIPDTVTQIKQFAFSWCKNLREVKVPDSVQDIGLAAFTGCSQLKKMTLPFVGSSQGATYEKDTEQNYSHFGFIFGAKRGEEQEGYIPSTLTDIVITGGTRICNYTFAYLRNVKNIVLPETIERIDAYAYFWCEGLEKLAFPDSVELIGLSTLNGCSHLVEIQVPFVGEKNNGIYGNVGYLFGTDDYLKNRSYMPDTLRKVVLTKQETLAKGAFYGLPDLKTVIVPSTLTSVEDKVFEGCKSLEYFEKDGIHYLGNDDNKYFIAIAVADNETIETISIDENCKFMSSGAFQLCNKIENVVLPNGLISIGDRAFYRCENLKSVTVSDSIRKIGDGAFYNCENLESVNISADSVINKIGRYAFYNCKKLTSIYFPTTLVDIDYCAFMGCHGLSTVKIVSTTEYCEIRIDNALSSPFKNATSLEIGGTVIDKDLIFDDSIRFIKANAFCGLSFIESVTLSSSLTSIGERAFSDCVGLTKVKYNGTMQKWKSVSLAEDWLSGTTITKVECLDGTVDL